MNSSIKLMMTNCKIDVLKDPNYESSENHLAAIAAVNIVKQILDDAFSFANAVRESGIGDSWRYLPLCDMVNKGMIKSALSSNIQNSISDGNNITSIATSTPQKCPDNKRNSEEDDDGYYNGQGDCHNEVTQSYSEDSKSPSMLINNLFDMSEVEREFEVNKTINEVTDNSDITKVIESYVNDALNMAFDEDLRKEYSMKREADVVSHFEKAVLCSNVSLPNLQMEQEDTDLMLQIPHTFLTLNREDEQESEKADIYINSLEESKTTFQEIKLMSSNSSQDNLSLKIKDSKLPTTGPRRNTLARSCRNQGARLFSCVRKLWSRSTPKKRSACITIKDSTLLSPRVEYHSSKQE